MLQWLAISILLPLLLGLNQASNNAPLADGSEVQVDRKGFSITPPVGWEIHRDFPGTSLMLQIPFSKQIPYQRTIQIMTFSGAEFMDEVTAQTYKDRIKQKYTKSNHSIENFDVRNPIMTEMQDNRKGILFYSSFSLEGKPMMQAHILVSSDKAHYLITYTDVASHFEGDDVGEHLNIAWNAMTSIKLNGPTPERFKVPSLILFGFLLLCGIGLLIYLVRKRQTRKKLRGLNFEETGDGNITHTDLEFYDSSQEMPTGIIQTGQGVKSLVTDSTDWNIQQEKSSEKEFRAKDHVVDKKVADFGTTKYSINPLAKEKDEADDDEDKEQDQWNLK